MFDLLCLHAVPTPRPSSEAADPDATDVTPVAAAASPTSVQRSVAFDLSSDADGAGKELEGDDGNEREVRLLFFVCALSS